MVCQLKTPSLSLAKARNVAAKQATGRYLLFLDVDCIPSSRVIEMTKQTLERQDAIVCSEVLYLDVKRRENRG